MVSTFTKEQFEAALPVDKKQPPLGFPETTGNRVTTVKMWEPLGIIDGEYCYLIHIAGREDFGIMVRSSVQSNGRSADAGEDSIRCWIVEAATKAPWGSKISKYVTRVPGWETRMLDTLRKLYKMALAIERCPACQQWMKVFRVRRPGPNKGRVFIKCANLNCPNRLGHENGYRPSAPSWKFIELG